MYLNLSESEYDKYIYRIVCWKRFKELFDDQQNTLVKPKLWDDTFENFALKSTLKYPDGSEIQLDTHERLYGQCWTKSKASDAMWRIYSKDNEGIRIRTTVNKLLEGLDIANADAHMTMSCIGKVEYKSESTIMDHANKIFTTDGRMTFGSLFRSLLIKRKAFKHENEIRLLHLDWKHELPKTDVYSYKINPHDLITQVMIDPRKSPSEFKTIEKRIRQETGYKGDIKRSLLYKLPKKLHIEV